LSTDSTTGYVGIVGQGIHQALKSAGGARARI